MSKYRPLEAYLLDCASAELDMSFAEIEAVLGTRLPRSAARRQWWANEANEGSTHVQCRAWRRAGYEARPLLPGRLVRFRRTGGGEPQASLERDSR